MSRTESPSCRRRWVLLGLVVTVLGLLARQLAQERRAYRTLRVESLRKQRDDGRRVQR